MSIATYVTLGRSLDPNDTEQITLNVLNSSPSTNRIKYCKVCFKNITLDISNIAIAITIPDPILDVCLTPAQLDDINNGLLVSIPLGAIKTGTTNADGSLNEATPGDADLNATIETSVSECKAQPNTSAGIKGITVTP